MLLRFILLISPLLITAASFGQERCGTVEYQKMLHKSNPKKETIDQFEKWMNNKLNQAKTAPASTLGAQRTQTTYTIPVVVHVIHNGEPIGTGKNISDAQILSQIKVLNDDFNRLNADKTNTPSVFQSVAGSFDIQFILAQQDPNGLATNGIVRIIGSQSSWTFNNNYLLKSQSYWPAEQYLNVWVTNLIDYLGYTQFPVSPLPGLEDSSNERLTDGIVINYREFGSIDGGSFDLHPKYNKGRTLTHEMGHFFGLRHIWGDGSDCTSTDFVADTPTQSNSSSGCPTHPQTDCSATKMFQNYLDYSDDACMNLFTQAQVSRMNTIIQNSPRRKELPNSIGSLPPTSVPNDLGIKTILSPGRTACAGSIFPSITIRNYGINTITSAQILLKKNGSTIETKNIAISLLPNAELQVDFNPTILTSTITTPIDFLISQTNTVTDGNANNNLKSISTTTPVIGTLPITESFATIPTTWSIDNPDGLTTWQTSSPSGRSAMMINFYDYVEIGATDRIVTPLLDLTSATSATLIFDRAYAQYPGTTGDSLRVLVTTDCRFDVSPTVKFKKGDADLATAPDSSSPFAPTRNQWTTEVISLDQFVGQSIQIAFEGKNANGNNLYLSDVRVFTGPFIDLSLVQVESPSPVSCLTNPSPTILIKNNGNVPVTSFTVSTTLNNGSTQLKTISGLSIAPNAEQSIQLNPITLNTGSNQFVVLLSNPNGLSDDNPQNNGITYALVLNKDSEIIPLRERFDSNSQAKWTIVSQGQQATWAKTFTASYNNSLFYNSFTNTNLGDESWLVSPVLDLSRTTKASLFFDLSYASNPKGVERLHLMASKDCGVTFTNILFDQQGSLLSNTTVSPPSNTIDWKRNFIKLDDWAGNSTMRFAFVVTNGNGNDVYLDNIDFFIDNASTQVFPESSYSVYGGINSPISMTFNLEERQLVNVQIYNSIGQVIVDYPLPETLNQTYLFDLGERGAGIYIIRVQIGNQLSAKKVFVGN
jgi:hypothetical protein